MSHDDRFLIRKQEVAAQSHDGKADRANRKRVPSALTPDDRQREAVHAVRAGRSMCQVAKEFSVSHSLIQELYLLYVERKTEDLRAQVKEIDDERRGRKPLARKAAA